MVTIAEEMLITQIADQLDQFREFALARLSSAGEGLTLDALYDEWRTMNPDRSQMEADHQAVAASLRDYRSGVSGKPAADVVRRLKSQLANDRE
jgi:hypothetical protein